jgi:magnesium transporter
MRFDLRCISEETRPYFRDIYDNVIRINDMVDNTRELLNSAMEANFSLISIAQSDVSRRFAGWAAIIAIPTMVAGFYGMNFEVIPEAKWEFGFYAVIIGTIAACVLLYYLFKKSKWL